jgi:O-antigen/teichoic acid export membrane protein
MIISIKTSTRKLLGHTVFRSGVVMMVGSVVGNIAAYLYHVFVGRILGPEQYGTFGALLSIFYILNVPSGVIQTIFTKFFSILSARNSPGEAKQLSIYAYLGLGTVVLIGFVVLLPFLGSISTFLRIRDNTYILYLYLAFAVYFLSMINMSALQGFQKFGAVSFFTNLGASLRLVIGIVGAMFGLAATLIANIISTIVGFALLFIPMGFILKKKSIPVQLSKRDAARYSVSTMLAMLGMTAIYSLDVVLVKHFFPPVLAGIYVSLSTLGKVVFFLTATINAVLFPVVAGYKESQKSYTKMVMLVALIIAGLSLSMTAMYFLFPKFSVHLLYGSTYDQAIPLVGIFGLFISCFSLANYFVLILLAIGHTRIWLLTIGASISQIILIFLRHNSLREVIVNNLTVSFLLVLCIIVYYIYVHNDIRKLKKTYEK